jgi:hypothetical protein
MKPIPRIEAQFPGSGFPGVSRHRKYLDLILRAANMRLLSRALASAVLVSGALLPTASQAQVVPAIKGGGSQINVYGLYSLVKSDFQSTLDYPPGATPPSNTNDANGWLQGGAGGADFRLGRFVFGQPTLGVRFTYATGTFGSHLQEVASLRRLPDWPRRYQIQRRADG